MTTTQLDILSCNVLHVKGDADANRFLPRQGGSSGGGVGGQLAYAQITASQTGIGNGTQVAVAGLSVTVSVAAGRILKITGYAQLDVLSTPTAAELCINEDGNIVQIAFQTTLAGAAMFTPIVQRTPTAGSHTYALTVSFSANSDNRVNSTVLQPCFILVEDIGGA